MFDVSIHGNLDNGFVLGRIKRGAVTEHHPYYVVNLIVEGSQVDLFLTPEQAEKVVDGLNKSLLELRTEETAQREDQEDAYRHEMSAVV